jgi:hypothetical protein
LFLAAAASFWSSRRAICAFKLNTV